MAKKTDAEKQMDARAKELRQAAEDREKMAADAKPTPTQEENDKAKLGILDGGLEDDGSPEQESDAPPASPRAGVNYSTRDAAKKD